MEICEERNVLLGNEEYIYQKNINGEELLKRTETIDGKDIEVVIRSKESEKSKEIENFVIDVLSDLFIQRHLKKYM